MSQHKEKYSPKFLCQMPKKIHLNIHSAWEKFLKIVENSFIFCTICPELSFPSLYSSDLPTSNSALPQNPPHSVFLPKGAGLQEMPRKDNKRHLFTLLKRNIILFSFSTPIFISMPYISNSQPRQKISLWSFSFCFVV